LKEGTTKVEHEITRLNHNADHLALGGSSLILQYGLDVYIKVLDV
jgi:hypothetical protein